MLRTLEKETGIKLEFKHEILVNKNIINTIFFELADDDQHYVLAIAYDKKALSVFSSFSNDAIWSGKLFNNKAILFEYDQGTMKRLTHELLGLECSHVAVAAAADGDPSNFSMTRFTEIYENEKCLYLNVASQGSRVVLPIYIDGEKAVLGTWMNCISRAALLFSIEYIFNNFNDIKTIEYKNVPYTVLLDRGWRHNDYFMKLPESVDELRKNMTSKSRYNIRREKRIIEKTFGDLELENVKAEDVTSDIIEMFYKFKGETHGVTQNDYDITKLPITDYYLLKTGDGTIRAIALSCEQGSDVFIENHTFDSSMREYSFGKILYEMYIEALIEKGKTGLALAGGSLDYKNRYGTYCAITWSGIVSRNSFKAWKMLKRIGLGERPLTIRRWVSRADRISSFIHNN